jgi:hypothetical protein
MVVRIDGASVFLVEIALGVVAGAIENNERNALTGEF